MTDNLTPIFFIAYFNVIASSVAFSRVDMHLKMLNVIC